MDSLTDDEMSQNFELKNHIMNLKVKILYANNNNNHKLFLYSTF